TINGGELSAQGVELGLSASAVQTHDLDLSLRATFAKNKQRIENLPATVPRFPAPGSFGAAFGRNFISPGGETTWIWGNVPLDANHKPLPIGVLVTDPSAVAFIRDTVAGNYNPDFVMEFSSSLRWKRRALAAALIPGAQPARVLALLELRSRVQQLRDDQSEPVHRPGAVPLQPPVLPIRGRGVVSYATRHRCI